MEGKYLSEVIDFKKDIAPYRIIQIYSGVGSGKNYWVESLAKEGYRILLITSRKATADAQAKKLKGTRWVDLDEIAQQGFGAKAQKKVIVTNAGIEQFIKKKYIPDDEKTHIWRYFDFIILDEAHSLVSDATFSDSPFHVHKFLKFVQESAKDCKLVFMTGTPEPIERFFSEKLKNSAEYNYLNLYDQCKHVDPEEIYLYPYFDIEKDLLFHLQKGDRIIYFANSITRMESMVANLCNLGLDENCIGVAYADKNKRKFPKAILDRKDFIRESLIKDEMLPPEIQLFISTSQNKEGININNDDIKIMVSESCDRASLIQMAGRVRKGLEVLVILYGAPQHPQTITDLDIEVDHWCLKSVREFWEYYEFTSENKEEICAIEGKFPAIRYNYLQQRFDFYPGKERGFEQINEDQRYLRNCIATWGEPPKYMGYECVAGQGEEDIKKWFPYSKVELCLEKSLNEQMDILEKEINEFIERGGYIQKEITKEDKQIFLDQLNDMLEEIGCNFDALGIKKPVKQLNPFLNKFGYIFSDAPGHRKGTLFVLKKLD